jgi:hypothetical protein
MTTLIPAFGLLFTDVHIHVVGKILVVRDVIVDTGSAGTLFRTDDLLDIGVVLEEDDEYVNMEGIGGSEVVLQKWVDRVEVGELTLSPFRIQMGRVDYGFGINGILGLDFLLRTGAIIDLKMLQLRQG